MGIVEQSGDHDAFPVKNWALRALKVDALERIVLSVPFGMVKGACPARNLEGSALEEDARLDGIVRHAQSGMVGDAFLARILDEAALKEDVFSGRVGNAKPGEATRV